MYRSKYKVDQSPEGRAKRTFQGRTYASQAECEYAKELAEELKEGHISEVVPQPSVQLGEDTVYKPDFLVVCLTGITPPAYYVDVKGVETQAFKRHCKLWEKYGRLPLYIVKKTGRGFSVKEIIR